MNEIAYCFDLDGTLTLDEILPIIAKEIDLFEEINMLTNATMKGLLPFENSFKLRVKLLSTIPISTIQQIIAEVRVDQNLKSFIQANKSNCYIVTGNLDVWVGDFISNTFGCKYFSSKAKLSNGKIEGIENIINKGHAITEIRKNYNKTVAIGDGMNDCSMLADADIGISYGGIHDPAESLVSVSDYVTYNSRSLVRLLNNFK